MAGVDLSADTIGTVGELLRLIVGEVLQPGADLDVAEGFQSGHGELDRRFDDGEGIGRRVIEPKPARRPGAGVDHGRVVIEEGGEVLKDLADTAVSGDDGRLAEGVDRDGAADGMDGERSVAREAGDCVGAGLRVRVVAGDNARVSGEAHVVVLNLLEPPRGANADIDVVPTGALVEGVTPSAVAAVAEDGAVVAAVCSSREGEGIAAIEEGDDASDAVEAEVAQFFEETFDIGASVAYRTHGAHLVSRSQRED